MKEKKGHVTARNVLFSTCNGTCTVPGTRYCTVQYCTGTRTVQCTVKRHCGEPGHTRGTRAHTGIPVKRHRGEPGHTCTGHTGPRDTRAHAGKRITRTNLTTIHPNPTTQTRTKTATDSTAPAQEQPQARSRPLPAADSEEAAPGEPDPASCLHPLTLYGIGVGSPKFCIHNVNEKRGAADCRRAPCSFIVQFAVKGACRRLRAARIW